MSEFYSGEIDNDEQERGGAKFSMSCLFDLIFFVIEELAHGKNLIIV